MKSNEAILTVTGITKIYGNTLALNNVSFLINSGEWVSVMGPSGSGKTTLLGIISGIIKPSSGKVILTGKEITAMNDEELSLIRRQCIGLVFQEYNLIPYLTALENVMMAQYFHSIVDEGEAVEVLHQIGLAERMHHFPAQLSGGEQQRVSIARAIVNRPLLLLADEPTGNLDRTNAQRIMEIFKQLNEELGVTIICATHDEFVASFSHRTLILHDGRLSGERVR